MAKKIEVKGAIISSNHQRVYDYFNMEAVSPKKINELLEDANGEDIEFEINSGGGSVNAASEIYTSIKSYNGKTRGKIVGLAASAASVIAMGVDYLEMSPTAQIMIHNSESYAEGDYREMENSARILKTVNDTIANAYRMKTGKTQAELLKLMDNETWMTAEKAKDLGFIDSIMFEDEIRFVANENSSIMLPNEVIEKFINENIDNSELDNKELNENKIVLLKAKLDLEIESSYFYNMKGENYV